MSEGELNGSEGRKVKRRLASCARELLCHVNIDSAPDEYPIYVAEDGELWLRKRPQSAVATFHVKVRRVERDVRGERLPECFSSREDVERLAELASLELIEPIVVGAEALLTLSNVDRRALIFEVEVEAYAGDMERFLGVAGGRIVKLFASSLFGCDERKAWAISFEWEKRIRAKYPVLGDYVRAEALRGRRCRAGVAVKVPISSEELEALFRDAVGAGRARPPTQFDLEREVRELQALIEVKRAELKALEERLQALTMKLKLEVMKREVIESGH